MVKICAISDIHNKHKKIKIEPCVFVICAGDIYFQGRESEVRDFAKWFDKQPAKYLVMICGNHERDFETYWPESQDWIKEESPRTHLLMDSSVVIEGIKIYGSPVTPWFCSWAYNKARNQWEKDMHGVGLIKPYWDQIDDDTNILVTHGPPYGVLDELSYVDGTPKGQFVGCVDLMNRIKELKDLDLHIFGHIHCHGSSQVHRDGVSYYNASICDEMYLPSNPVTVIEYEK